jgi:hypothetical protein
MIARAGPPHDDVRPVVNYWSGKAGRAGTAASLTLRTATVVYTGRSEKGSEEIKLDEKFATPRYSEVDQGSMRGRPQAALAPCTQRQWIDACGSYCAQPLM